MTGPDRIFAIAWETDAGHGEWDVLDNDGTEYVRRDPAVLAALPEVQALIAAAYEVAAERMDAGFSYNAGNAIRALTPADATAALAARDAAMRARGMREAAEMIERMGFTARFLRARAAEIEGDGRITCTGQQSPIE